MHSLSLVRGFVGLDFNANIHSYADLINVTCTQTFALLPLSQHTDKFKRHFKCNLQECDTNYERNSFEESLLLSVRKAHSLEREVAQIPKTTATFMAKQRDAKLKGPKLGALKQRSDMVKCQVESSYQLKISIDHFLIVPHSTLSPLKGSS